MARCKVKMTRDHKCLQCGLIFQKIKEFRKHFYRTHKNSIYFCDHCEGRFLSRETLRVHLKKLTCSLCKKLCVDAKRLKEHEEACRQCTINVICKECGQIYRKCDEVNHYRSDLHIRAKQIFSEKIFLIDTALNNNVKKFVYEDSEYITGDLKVYLEKAKNVLLNLISNQVIELGSLKVQLMTTGIFNKPYKPEGLSEDDIEEAHRYFYSTFKSIYHGDIEDGTFESLLQEMYDEIGDEEEHYQGIGSGWSAYAYVSINITIIKVQSFGRGYLHAGDLEKRKKVILNIKNKDKFCLMYCVCAFFHSKKFKKSPQKAINYRQYFKDFNFKEFKWPIDLKNIKKFEIANEAKSIAINIYKREDKDLYGVLRVSPFVDSAQNVIDLLLLERNESFHYCLILNLVRLVRRGRTTDRRSDSFICRKCLGMFHSRAKYEIHCIAKCTHVMKKFPIEKPFVEFERYSATNRHMCVVYSDLESILIEDHNLLTKSKIKTLHRHEACMAAYKFAVTIGEHGKDKVFTGENCLELYFKSLFKDVYDYYEKYYFILSAPFPIITPEVEESLSQMKNCIVCLKEFTGHNYSIDHNHLLTDQFLINNNRCYPKNLPNSSIRGKLHMGCNLNLKDDPVIYLYFHNGSKYDFILLIAFLAKYKMGEITVLPKTHNRFLAFTLRTKIKNRDFTFNFHDSFNHMNGSLSSIAENVDLIETRKLFKHYLGDGIDEKIINKLPMWYEKINSFKSLENSYFPEKSDFSSVLRPEITDEEYELSHFIWKKLNCKTWKNYLEFYLRIDVTLLFDCMESVRDASIEHFKLDCITFVSLPSYTFTAFLKWFGHPLELITDPTIYELIQNSIRGGIVYGTKHFIQANNPFTRDWKPEEETSYLQFFDICSLYSNVMTRFPFPVNNFQLINDKSTLNYLSNNILNFDEHQPVGYFFLVDLEIPASIHDQLSDFHCAPTLVTMKDSKTKKLVVDCYPKKNYFCHYLLIKKCLEIGMVLTNMNLAVSFNQSKHLSNYVSYNNDLRRQPGLSEFSKARIKLYCNSLYGRFLTNVKNFRNYKLISNFRSQKYSKMDGNKYFLLPSLKSVSIFSENLVGVEHYRTFYNCNQLLAHGKVVLDIAKVIVMEKMQLLKGIFNDVEFIFGDTDSMVISCKKLNPYEIIKNNMEHFDTTSFKGVFGIEQCNYKVSGLLGCELAGRIFDTFIYKSPKVYLCKAYYYNETENHFKMAAKGISRQVCKTFTFNHYRSKNPILVKMYSIIARGFQLYTVEQEKVALETKCNKRKFLSESLSYPWGHYKIINEIPPYHIDDSSFESYLRTINEKEKYCKFRIYN